MRGKLAALQQSGVGRRGSCVCNWAPRDVLDRLAQEVIQVDTPDGERLERIFHGEG